MYMPTKHAVRFTTILLLTLFQACSPSYAYKENAVPKLVELSPRLQALFAKTKLVCFGRYVLAVPQEAQLIWGSASFPSRIDVIRGGLDASKRRVADDVEKLKRKDDTADITYSGVGPIHGSWQLRYYEDDVSKKYGLHFFNTYVNMGDLTFLLGGSVGKGNTENAAAAREAIRARSLRLRAPDEVPNEPGFCIEHGFMLDELYATQEMVSVGIYIPSLPDVTFSISSNKNAYADSPPEIPCQSAGRTGRILFHSASSDKG